MFMFMSIINESRATQLVKINEQLVKMIIEEYDFMIGRYYEDDDIIYHIESILFINGNKVNCSGMVLDVGNDEMYCYDSPSFVLDLDKAITISFEEVKAEFEKQILNFKGKSNENSDNK